MVLARWSPFPVATLPSLFQGRSSFGGWNPSPLDVQRREDGYRIQAPLPGFKPEDVEVTLERGTLTISARRSEETETEQGRYLRREVYSGSFKRQLVLPAEVTAEDVQASFENGLLTVDVRHAPASAAVSIPVGAGGQPAPQDTQAA